MQNNKLDQRLENLPAHIQPEQDLWPDLAVLLVDTPQHTVVASVGTAGETAGIWRGWWYGMAATLLISMLTWWQWPAAQYDVGDTAKVTGLAVVSAGSTIAAPSSDQTLMLTSWQLISLFETDKARLLAQLTVVPEVYGDWRQQLDVWQQASRQIQFALQYQPEAPELLQQLHRIQQQQLAYLQKLVLSDLS